MKSKAIEFKKRLMFLKGEDLYFLTYNAMVLLKGFSCQSKMNAFYDCSKIAFLIDFIADSRLTGIITSIKQDGTELGDTDRQQLQSVYTEGLVRKHIVSRVVFALEKKGFVSLEMKHKAGIVNIWLEPKKIPINYFQTELYEAEFENVTALKGLLPRLRTMSLNTLLARIFQDNGVSKWHV